MLEGQQPKFISHKLLHSSVQWSLTSLDFAVWILDTALYFQISLDIGGDTLSTNLNRYKSHFALFINGLNFDDLCVLNKMLEAGAVTYFVAGLSIGIGLTFLSRTKASETVKPEKTKKPDAGNEEDEWEEEETESEEGLAKLFKMFYSVLSSITFFKFYSTFLQRILILRQFNSAMVQHVAIVVLYDETSMN